MFKICSLFSGSSGNSTLISSSDGPIKSYKGLSYGSSASRTSILIDSGVSAVRLQKAMTGIGENCMDVSGILLTHDHSDHLSGIGVAVRRFKLPLYVTRKTWDNLNKSKIGAIPDDLLNIFNAGEKFAIKDFEITSFSTPHDAIDSVGFRIDSAGTGISYMTDIGYVEEAFEDIVIGSKAVFIESNYDTDMLFNGSYPWHLKKRIDGSRGHLSNADCAQAVARLLSGGTEYFVLSHLSQENNTPGLAKEATVGYLLGKGAENGKDYRLQVSPRHIPGEPWFV